MESDLRQRPHHRWSGECFGEEQDVWVGVVDLPEHLVPKRTVWCGVIDAEDPNAAIGPESNDSNNLIDEAFGIAVEPDRVDVLVLLGRVLCVRDRAIRAHDEPRLSLRRPRVVRAQPAGWVEGDLKLQLVCSGDKLSKSSRVPRSGCTDSCPPKGKIRSPMAIQDRWGQNSTVLFRTLRLTSPMGWIGGM